MRVRAAVTTLLVGCLLLAGGAVAVDQVSRTRAESAAQRAVVGELTGVVGAPRVDIHGFPFLTQVWSGALGHVTGSLAGATVGGTMARDVQLDARGVHLGEPLVVDQVTLSATVPTSAVRTALAARTGMATLQVEVRDGALVVSVDQLGVPVQITGRPAVHDGDLTVTVEVLRIGTATIDVADLPSALRALLADLVVPVDDLPDGLTLADAQVVPTGIRITASGTHVRLSAATGSSSPSAPFTSGSAG